MSEKRGPSNKAKNNVVSPLLLMSPPGAGFPIERGLSNLALLNAGGAAHRIRESSDFHGKANKVEHEKRKRGYASYYQGGKLPATEGFSLWMEYLT